MTLQLEIQNFRRFVGDGEGAPVTVAFEPGLTIITGPNGAGKTTLADALHYALFGRQRSDVDPLADAAAGGRVMVACHLLIDGRPVRIERWSDRASLWVDDTIQVQEVAGSLKSVSGEVRALLGDLTPEQFSQLYVAAQGQTAGLVEARPSQRRVVVEEVLQVEVLRAAAAAQAARHDRARGSVIVAGTAAARVLNLSDGTRRHLDRFDGARVTRTRRETLSHFVAGVEAALSDAHSALSTYLERADALTKEVDRLECGEREARAQRVAAQSRLNAFDVAAKEYQARDTVVRERRQGLVKLEATRDTLAAQLDEARAAEPQACRHAAILAEIDALDEERARLALWIERAKAVKAARDSRDDLVRRVAALQGVSERHRTLVEEHGLARLASEAMEDDPTAAGSQVLAGDQRALEDARKETETSLAALEMAGEEAGTCPICGGSLTPAAWHDLVGRYRRVLTVDLPDREREVKRTAASLKTARIDWQRRRREAGEVAADLLKRAEGARKDVEAATDVAGQLSKAEQRLTEVTAALNQLGPDDPDGPTDEDLMRRRGELATEATALSEAAKRYALAPNLIDRLAASDQPIRLQREGIAEAEAERDALGYDEGEHQVCRDQQEVLTAALLRAMEAKSERARILDGLRREAEAAQVRAEQGELAAAELAEAADAYARAARLHDTFDEFVKEYVAANTRRITERATELVRQAATDGSILGLKLDERGELAYIDSSSVPRPIARLSGGEKALVGLCLRLALAEQALLITRSGRLDFLFLDEVLSALDDERRDAMQRVFAAVQARGLFRHILMITHLEAVRDGWPAHNLEVRKVGPKSSQVVMRLQADVVPVLEMVEE